MQDVWFDLEDGTTVDPNDCAPDKDGVLRHKSGRAVKMRAPGVPYSRGVDVAFGGKGDHDRNGTAGGTVAPVIAAEPPALPKATVEMKPAAPQRRAKKPGYKTR